MPGKEASNIIIQLRLKDWDEEEINDFIAFVETHNPVEGSGKGKEEKQTGTIT